MPKVKITNTFALKIKPPTSNKKEVYSDTIDIGFVLEVRSTGTKTFYYRYNKDGRTHQQRLSSINTLTANKARDLVKKLKSDNELHNSTLLKNLIPNATITLKEFFNHHFYPYIKTYKKSYKADYSFYKNHILPVWSNTPMDKITPAMISKLHIDLVSIKNLSKNTANKFLHYLSHTYNLAIKWEIDGVANNPVSKVKLFTIDTYVERYLDKYELKRLVEVLVRTHLIWPPRALAFGQCTH